MTQTLSPDARLALVMHENLAQGFGKMGFGMLRYSQQDIVAVLDRQTAGQDLVALTGIPRPTPIVATIAEAIALGADTLVLGVANPGGVLPSDWWAELKEGLAMGMSLVNGLHNPLAENPELKPLLQPGRFIWDVRREPEGLVNGTGRARETTAKRILCVGTDMSIGKMTAALELDRVARARGLRSKFLASGQTGICIAGDGVPLDAVRVDFASGAMEQLVLRYGFDHDLLFIEGQGSLLHPASTAWLPLVRGNFRDIRREMHALIHKNRQRRIGMDGGQVFLLSLREGLFHKPYLAIQQPAQHGSGVLHRPAPVGIHPPAHRIDCRLLRCRKDGLIRLDSVRATQFDL